MKVKIRIRKSDASLEAGPYDVVDGATFGEACADAWWQLRQKLLAKDSSIGALMEDLESKVLDQLDGAQISVEKA